MNYYGLQHGVDGSIFGKLMHHSSFLSCAHHLSYFKRYFILLPCFWCLVKRV